MVITLSCQRRYAIATSSLWIRFQPVLKPTEYQTHLAQFHKSSRHIPANGLAIFKRPFFSPKGIRLFNA